MDTTIISHRSPHGWFTVYVGPFESWKAAEKWAQENLDIPYKIDDLKPPYSDRKVVR